MDGFSSFLDFNKGVSCDLLFCFWPEINLCLYFSFLSYVSCKIFPVYLSKNKIKIWFQVNGIILDMYPEIFMSILGMTTI